jgi:small GTP-binding protein
MISKKVILTGSFGVGKTSLFNQFIFQSFSDKYLTTIGVKVNKKTVTVGDDSVSILLWDIAGEISQDKVPNSYFLGAAAVIYVVDLGRPATFVNAIHDIQHLRKLIPDCVLKIVGNKNDLVQADELRNLEKEMTHPCDIYTSAKTGENVEALFSELAADLLASE